MSLLAITAGSAGVTATLVRPDGTVGAWAHHPVDALRPAPDRVELVPEALWQAALGAVREVVDRAPSGAPAAVGVVGERDTLLLWDAETLGAPRPGLAAADRRTADLVARLDADGTGRRVAELTGRPLRPGSAGPRLAWLAAHERHTWALVEAGRYVAGTLGSYLVARMTRGTWHVTDVADAEDTALLDPGTGAWSEEVCGLLGVPPDALPEVVPTWGEVARTDARSFLGLALPVTALAVDDAALLAGLGCTGEGAVACAYDAEGARVLAPTGAAPAPPGVSRVAVWGAPGGGTSYAAGARTSAGDGVAAVGDLVGALLRTPGELRVDGPGASDERCQAQADLLGVPVHRGGPPGAVAVGGALLAGLGAGTWSSLEQLRGAWRPERSFHPR